MFRPSTTVDEIANSRARAQLLLRFLVQALCPCFRRWRWSCGTARVPQCARCCSKLSRPLLNKAFLAALDAAACCLCLPFRNQSLPPARQAVTGRVWARLLTTPALLKAKCPGEARFARTTLRCGVDECWFRRKEALVRQFWSLSTPSEGGGDGTGKNTSALDDGRATQHLVK